MFAGIELHRRRKPALGGLPLQGDACSGRRRKMKLALVERRETTGQRREISPMPSCGSLKPKPQATVADASPRRQP